MRYHESFRQRGTVSPLPPSDEHTASGAGIFPGESLRLTEVVRRCRTHDLLTVLVGVLVVVVRTYETIRDHDRCRDPPIGEILDLSADTGRSVVDDDFTHTAIGGFVGDGERDERSHVTVVESPVKNHHRHTAQLVFVFGVEQGEPRTENLGNVGDGDACLSEEGVDVIPGLNAPELVVCEERALDDFGTGHFVASLVMIQWVVQCTVPLDRADDQSTRTDKEAQPAMSHPYPPLGMSDNKDDDGQVFTDLLPDSHEPADIRGAVEPVDVPEEVIPKPVTRLHASTVSLASGALPQRLLSEDLSRVGSVFVKVQSQAATPTVADYLIISDGQGKISAGTATIAIKAYSGDLIEIRDHTGAIYAIPGTALTGNIEVSAWSVNQP